MKKKIIFIFMFLFIILFSLTSCDNKEDIIDNNDNNNENINNNENDNINNNENIKTKLSSPILSYDETNITWDKIDNADAYIVNLDGNDLDLQTSNSFELVVSENGEYLIKVKAISNDENYIDSDYSSSITIYIYDELLSTPNIQIDEDNYLISWNKIKHADYYVININGIDESTTTELKYDYSNLKTNDYVIKIKAKSNSYDYGMSDYSNELNFSYVYEKTLDTPKIILNTNTLTWDEIENASSYVIYIDDEFVSEVTNCYYDLTNIEYNKHKIKIKAKSNLDKYYDSLFSNEITYKISNTGYLDSSTGNFYQYEGTDSYVIVHNSYELLNAIIEAKWDYETNLEEIIELKDLVERKNVRKNETNWNNAINKGLYIKNEDGTWFKIPSDTPFSDTSYTADMTYYEDSPYSIVSYSQTLNEEGKIHVIEIANDIDLGWNKLSLEEQNLSIASDFSKNNKTNESLFTMSSMYLEYGMTQIAIENINDLLIYSKNGSKILHGGFKVNYCNNVCFRNLEFDELWQWEDTSSVSAKLAVGDMDAFGWAYFKIGFSDEIWIDHCTFGKSYDGQIDIANPTYNTLGTYEKAPYLGDGSSDVHISWCCFKSGSDDPNGYLYKMMQEIELDYQKGDNNYLYYKALRDAGYTFDEILYGIAIPQKKAFLDGDGTDSNYYYNKDYNENLSLSIAYCSFIDVEDRIPKIRSGNVYMYGTIVDCSRYYQYRELLKSKIVDGTKIDAKTVVAAVNSNWKCAGVSHAIVAGQDGSVYAEGCIFIDIESLLCNNDYGAGGVIIINSKYELNSISYEGSIFDDDELFTKTSSGMISSDYFFWCTIDNSIPFFINPIDLDNLENELYDNDYNVGINLSYEQGYLLKNYA